MDLELFQTFAKFPFIFNGTFYDAIELKQNKTCISKCIEKDCLNLFKSNLLQEEYSCSKGYDNILLVVGDIRFIINGIIYSNNQIIPQGRKEARKSWTFERNEVLLFIYKILAIERHLVKRTNESTEKNFSMFHDFKTSMTIFFTCTQDIISKLPGNTFIEKLEGSDKAYKSLYNALELITSQLRMVDVILNPHSIEFGNKKTINMYRLFEKIKILFEHLSTKKKGINIKLISEGRVENSDCFESIEFIPLILLDNALKYSVPDSDIEIKFEQNHRNLVVIVKNIGPFVSEENKERIFEKFFRDETGKAFSKEGIGMGLWIAQQILHAHNCKLYYYRDPREVRPIGLNVFQFEIQTK
jgi:hypothetical protein